MKTIKILLYPIDIVAIVHETGDLTTITTKSSQREMQKRDLGLVDDSGCLIRLTLWGNEAANFDGSSHPAIVVKSAKISDFNGMWRFVFYCFRSSNLSFDCMLLCALYC